MIGHRVTSRIDDILCLGKVGKSVGQSRSIVLNKFFAQGTYQLPYKLASCVVLQLEVDQCVSWLGYGSIGACQRLCIPNTTVLYLVILRYMAGEAEDVSSCHHGHLIIMPIYLSPIYFNPFSLQSVTISDTWHTMIGLELAISKSLYVIGCGLHKKG